MKSPENYNGRPILENQILQDSTTVTADGAGTAVLVEGYEVVEFQLDITAAATGAGDKLDVFVQTTIDGTNWLDVVHFTQALGNGSTKRFITKISASLAQTEYEVGTALGAAAVRNIMGAQYRVRWAVTDSGAHVQSFTFSVKANGT